MAQVVGSLEVGADVLGSVAVGTAAGAISVLLGNWLTKQILPSSSSQNVQNFASGVFATSIFLYLGPPSIAMVPGGSGLASELGLLAGVTVATQQLAGAVQLWVQQNLGSGL